MSKYTAATMRALGFSPRAATSNDTTAATSVPMQAGAAPWADIAASITAEVGASSTPRQAGAADWGDIAASLGAAKSAPQNIRKAGR